MPEQSNFDELELQEKRARIKALSADLDRRYKVVAGGIKRDRFAALNDKSYSYVSDILNTNDEAGQKPFQAGMIPALIVEKPDCFMKEVIGPICDLCGYERPEKKRKLSPEEELKELKTKIQSKGLEALFPELF